MTYNVLSPRRGMWELDPAKDYVYENGGGPKCLDGIFNSSPSPLHSGRYIYRRRITPLPSDTSEWEIC